MDYWIFKVEYEAGGLYGREGIDIFRHRSEEGFWGIREYTVKGKIQANVSLLKKGDCALFYLVTKEGGCFVGTCILDSGYEKLNEEQTKKIVHREYIDWDQGVFLNEVDKWAKPLPVECLREKVSFIRGGRNSGLFFQGPIKKIKNPADYRTIIREHRLTA